MSGWEALADLANFLTGGRVNESRIATQIAELEYLKSELTTPAAEAFLQGTVEEIKNTALPTRDIAAAKEIKQQAKQAAIEAQVQAEEAAENDKTESDENASAKAEVTSENVRMRPRQCRCGGGDRRKTMQ